MSTLALPRRWSVAAAGSNGIPDAASMVFRRMERRVRIWQDQRRLQALPDYLLDDIGISRGEIASATDIRLFGALGPSYRI